MATTLNIIRNRLKVRQEKYQKIFPDKSDIYINVIILKDLFVGLKAFIYAKLFLLGCDKVGKLPMVYNVPKILNHGYIKIGQFVNILSQFNQTKIFVDYNAQLFIGDEVRINGSHISVNYKVVIGNKVRIAPYCIIIDNDFHSVENYKDEGKKGEIIIEDDVWIATRVMILKSVKIGRGATVAAGSVVTKDVPPKSVVAGVPAKVIKYLE